MAAPQILWIGLGNMGRGMVKSLVQKGNLEKPVLLYNRTRKRSEDVAAALPEGKTEIVDSIEAGLARADIIFAIVSNDAAASAVFETILRAEVRGKLFVECSTLHPDTTDRLARDVEAAGAQFVASPVFGPPAAAEAGQLIFIPAGPKTEIDKIRPYIQGVMGKGEIPFEDQAQGNSLKLKLLGNTFIMNMVSILAEGMTMAEKTGVSPRAVQQLVDAMFGGPYSAYAERLVSGAYWRAEEPLFSANNARKDIGHARNLAAAAGMELRHAAVIDEHLQGVVKHSGGDKGDVGGMYGAVRQNAGLKFENDDESAS